MTAITIALDDAAVQRALTGLADQLEDMTPVMRTLAGTVAAAIEQNFATAGARLGPRWKPSYRAQAQGGQTLQDTGRLAASLSQQVTAHSAVVGTNVQYARIHHYGGVIRAQHAPYLRFQVGGRWASKKQVTLPARPFMALNAQDEQDLADDILDALQRALTR